MTTNAVREALAVANQLSAAHDNAKFELHIMLADGTEIHGVPYPMDPQAAEAIRLKIIADTDPPVPFPPPSPPDRFISSLAVAWVEIEWPAPPPPPPEGGVLSSNAQSEAKSEPEHRNKTATGRGKY